MIWKKSLRWSIDQSKWLEINWPTHKDREWYVLKSARCSARSRVLTWEHITPYPSVAANLLNIVHEVLLSRLANLCFIERPKRIINKAVTPANLIKQRIWAHNGPMSEGLRGLISLKETNKLANIKYKLQISSTNSKYQVQMLQVWNLIQSF